MARTIPRGRVRVAAFPLGTVFPAPATAAAGSPPAPAAARNFIEDAKSGDAAAQLELAIRFAEGGPSERHYEMAAQWYGKAAERGLAVAEYRLAVLYERGLGVAQDMQRAKNLYQRAAEKGNTRAMHNLGVLAVESADGKPNYTSAAL
jgi:localization factor PodJL